jgi:hypothetical protein
MDVVEDRITVDCAGCCLANEQCYQYCECSHLVDEGPAVQR